MIDSKYDRCQMRKCKNKTVNRCANCDQDYCEEHISQKFCHLCCDNTCHACTLECGVCHRTVCNECDAIVKCPEHITMNVVCRACGESCKECVNKVKSWIN
jgi:hypothetical protein